MKSTHAGVGFTLLFLVSLPFFFSSCGKVWHLADVKDQRLTISNELDSLLPRQDLIALIAPFKESMEKEMLRDIGIVSQTLKKQQPESGLSNWLGDVLLRQADWVSGRKTDVAFMNYGGIRLPEIPTGTVQVGKIYELMPFDNHIVILELSGTELIDICKHIASKGGGWPISEGIEMVISNGILVSLSFHDAPIKADKTYRVATSNFLADGGDGIAVLLGKDREDYPIMIRDAIVQDIEYMSAQNLQIKAPETGRIKYQPKS